MIHRINKPLPKKAIQIRIDIGLERQHVSRGKLLPRFQHPINPSRAPGSLPFRAEGVSITVRRDPAVCRGDDSGRRIEYAGQLLKRNVAYPFMSIVAAVLRQTAITRGANGDLSGSLIADVAIDIRIENVLAGRVQL